MEEPRLMRRLLYVLAALLLVLLFLGGPDGVPFRSFREVWNLGHVLAFALWSRLMLTEGPAALWPWRRQAAFVLAFAFFFGLLSEGLQVWFSRSPDAADLARDLLGGGVALAFLAPSRRALKPSRRRAVQAAALVGLASACVPLAVAGADDLRARSGFPVLSDFESPLETGRWRPGGSRISRDGGTAIHGRGSLRVDFSTDRYSGVYLRYFPGDWRGYRTLRLDAFNPDPSPLDVTIRIHDRHHGERGKSYRDRFNTVRTLLPGWNAIAIDLAEVEAAPRGRPMDMSRLEALGLFAAELPRPRTIHIDHVRLE